VNVQLIVTNWFGKRNRNTSAPTGVSSRLAKLQQLRFRPITKKFNVSRNKKRSFFFFKSTRVTPWEVAVFTRQLAATLASGLLLSEALDAVSGEMENEYFGEIIVSIRKYIHGGADFSSALAKFPKVFPVSFVAIVRAGEAIGSLDKTTASLAMYLEGVEQLKEKVKNAVTYPAFVFGFAFFVTLLLVLFLIPKFQEMYDQVNVQLPLLTRMVVGLSDFLIHFYGPILTFLAVIGVVLFKIRHIKAVQDFYDRLILRIPLIGDLIMHKFLISRFCRTAGLLLGGGVSISTALSITAQVVDYCPFTETIEEIRQRVVAGGTISTQIRNYPIFPSFVAKMVAVGEKTGKIADMLNKTADYFDNELDNTIRRLTILIEPALIIVIGGMISIIIVALYLPIFNVASLVQ